MLTVLVGVLIFLVLVGASMMTTGTVLTERRWDGEFIMSELNGTGSRDAAIMDSSVDAVTQPCTVVGKITLGAATATMKVGPDTIGTLSVSGDASVGQYSGECVAAGATGKFQVSNPAGQLIGEATVGTPFTAGGLTFTITDAGGHAALGDWFTIVVAAGSGKLKPLSASGATDGSDTVAGILYDLADTTGTQSAKCVLFARDGEVNASRLLWGSAATVVEAAVGSPTDTVGSISTGPLVKLGVYTAVCTLAGATGTFTVTDPNGLYMGTATVGTAFTSTNGELLFTITDASTHAVLGDTYTFTVTAPTVSVAGLAALGIKVLPSV